MILNNTENIYEYKLEKSNVKTQILNVKRNQCIN